LLSCSSFNDVHLVGRNFTDEVPLSQNMVFTFNKDLVQESRLGVWDSTQYVKFSPAVRGKFKWTAPNELVFSPVAALAPATAYKAELTNELLKHVDADKKYKVDDEDVDFHTPYLQLTELQSWWTRGAESGRPEARLRLTFNYPVDPQSVAERLKLSLRDNAATFRALPSSDGRNVVVALTQTGTPD